MSCHADFVTKNKTILKLRSVGWVCDQISWACWHAYCGCDDMEKLLCLQLVLLSSMCWLARRVGKHAGWPIGWHWPGWLGQWLASGWLGSMAGDDQAGWCQAGRELGWPGLGQLFGKHSSYQQTPPSPGTSPIHCLPHHRGWWISKPQWTFTTQ